MASTDGNRLIKNAPYRITFPLRNRTDHTLVTGLAGSMTTQLSEDSGAFAAVTNSPSEIGSTGIYYLDLVAGEVDSDIMVFKAADTNAYQYVEVLRPEPCVESGVAQAGTASTLTLRSGASSVDDFYNGLQVEIVRGTGLGQVRAISNYVGSSKLATLDRDWSTTPDTTSVYKITSQVGLLSSNLHQLADIRAVSDDAAVADTMEKFYDGAFIAGTVNDATPTTTVFDGNSGLSSSDDEYNRAGIVFTSGANQGLQRKISDYTGSTRTITVSRAFPTAPSNGDSFLIIGSFE